MHMCWKKSTFVRTFLLDIKWFLYIYIAHTHYNMLITVQSFYRTTTLCTLICWIWCPLVLPSIQYLHPVPDMKGVQVLMSALNCPTPTRDNPFKPIFSWTARFSSFDHKIKKSLEKVYSKYRETQFRSKHCFNWIRSMFLYCKWASNMGFT